MERGSKRAFVEKLDCWKSRPNDVLHQSRYRGVRPEEFGRLIVAEAKKKESQRGRKSRRS